MRSIASFFLIVCLSWALSAEPEAAPGTDPLVPIVEACLDALELGDKATAYALARKIRFEAMTRFKNEPHQLAPLLLLYADAAASYSEPDALIAYREAVVAYEYAFGPESQQLIEPSMRRGREALARKFRDEAFEAFQRVIELGHAHGLEGSAQVALARTGIATIRLRVGEQEGARQLLDEALKVDLERIGHLDLGWIYHVSADVYVEMADWQRANDHYTQAYGLYEFINSNKRDRLTILKRLVRVSHLLGKPERAINFCQMYAMQRDWGSRMLYDPSHKFSWHRNGNTALVGVKYSISKDCKAEDIVVTKADGIDPAKVKEVVGNAYWLPLYRDGQIVGVGEQHISSFIKAD